MKGTVVCLHGFLRGRGCTWVLAGALRRDGWRVVNWDYPSRSRTISGHAEALVADLRRLPCGEPISFVAHSLGGLVVRAALNRPDCPAEARQGRVVLLAVPNLGSSLARQLSRSRTVRWIFGPHAGRELLEAQDFEHLGPFPEGMPVLVMAGTCDRKVVVEEARPKTPHRLKVVRAGHSWIAWSPTVIREARAFLREEGEHAYAA